MTKENTYPPRFLGRVLRFLLGTALLAVALILPHWTLPYVLRVGSVSAGLLVFYLLLAWSTVRFSLTLHPWLGSFLSNGLIGLVMLAGIPNGWIFGRGEGFIGAAAYVGVSLMVAAWRADPGCEVMTLPAALLGRHTSLPCLLFTPLDALERK